MVRVVLDTNVLLVSISPNAPNHWVIRHFLNEDFILCVTTDILLSVFRNLRRNWKVLDLYLPSNSCDSVAQIAFVPEIIHFIRR